MMFSDVLRNIARLFLNQFLLFLLFLVSEPLLISARSPCPSRSVTKCFRKFFSTYRFMQWPTCQTFDYMEKCFQFSQCDTMELAHLCSAEYRKVHNSYLPKEAILAVRENLRQRCAPNCHRNLERECADRLSLDEWTRDRDQALLMEIKALKKQLELTMSPPTAACHQIHSALRRLRSNRKNACSRSSVFCLCRRMLDDLPKSCNLPCDRYRYSKNAELKIVGSVLLIVASVLIVETLLY